MKMLSHGTTDIGQRRERNEDAFYIDNQLGLFMVCDGMGGHAAGDVASQKTTELMVENVSEKLSMIKGAESKPGGYFKVVEFAELATIDVCRQLHELASSDPNYAGMGTTMTMLIVVNNKGIMAHVGDSRLYLLRHGELHLLSNDHTLANEMLLRGFLKKEQFDSSPYQHVLTKTVGSVEAVEPEMLLFDILPGDTFLLCSDGLTRYVAMENELAEFLGRNDLSNVPGDLVKLANERGGRDNITTVIVRVTDDSKEKVDAELTRLKNESLQQTFLCRGISFNRVLRLAETCTIRKYEPGEVVLKHREPCEGMYLIVDGKLAESQCESTSEFIAGDYLCETSLIRKREAIKTVVAVEPTTVLLLPNEDFNRLTRRFPKFGRLLNSRLLEYFVERVDNAHESA